MIRVAGFVTTLSFLASALAPATAQTITRSSDGKVARFKVGVSPKPIDFANAKPKALPQKLKAPPSQLKLMQEGVAASTQIQPKPGFELGADGDGVEMRTRVPKSKYLEPEKPPTASPQEYGSSNQPYTTSQATPLGINNSKFPYFRAAGKLFFNEGTDTFVCSASLVKKGLVVTAAHCVANFGTGKFYSNWNFVPGYNDGAAPYGQWAVADAYALNSYLDGTDSCSQSGVVCKDDVAVLVLKPQSGKYPGTSTGYFSIGYDGQGFTTAKQALLTQLGYPVALDSGELMERTDSQGAVSASDSNNTIIGSLQTGGSSGGPWIINFGQPIGTLASGYTYGTSSSHNLVVGATSWGYDKSGIKQMGASSFTSANIIVLKNAACRDFPGAC